MITKEKVLDALRQVQEPDLKADLVSLNMIRDVHIDHERISFTVVLTTPACPLKEKIKSDCLEALHKHLGQNIEIDIQMTAEVRSSQSASLLQGVKNVVAVASGKGGVGKSTVTANLAVALARTGARVGIVDADIFGPSIPTMFGVEGERPPVQEIEQKQYIIPVQAHGVKIISMGFLAPEESAIVWRGPMASKALIQFFGDVYWGELDYLLVDLPPGTSDIHLTLVQSIPLSGAVVVTSPQKVALADAIKAIAMFRQAQINVPLLGLIENMAYFTPLELANHRYYIFGKDGGKLLAERYSIPFLGEVPIVQAVREGGDSGIPITVEDEHPAAQAFAHIAARLAQELAIRTAEKAVV